VSNSVESGAGALLERIDDYAAARERVRETPYDDQPALRMALDQHTQAWQRLLDARYACSPEGEV